MHLLLQLGHLELGERFGEPGVGVDNVGSGFGKAGVGFSEWVLAFANWVLALTKQGALARGRPRAP